jgi:hypothetical protein
MNNEYFKLVLSKLAHTHFGIDSSTRIPDASIDNAITSKIEPYQLLNHAATQLDLKRIEPDAYSYATGSRELTNADQEAARNSLFARKVTVFNGSRLFEIHDPLVDEWMTADISDAGGLPKGVYDLQSAQPASLSVSADNKFAEFSGPVVHVDTQKIFQLSKGSIISHDYHALKLERAPQIGQYITINHRHNFAPTVKQEVRTQSSQNTPTP